MNGKEHNSEECEGEKHNWVTEKSVERQREAGRDSRRVKRTRLHSGGNRGNDTDKNRNAT